MYILDLAKCASLREDNPFAVFFAGDFKGYSQLWCSGRDTTAEGTAVEQLTSQLGLNKRWIPPDQGQFP